MKKPSVLFSGFLSVLLISCSSGDSSVATDSVKPIIIEDRIAFPDSAREAAFAQFRPETQAFTVDAGDDTMLVGKGGTTVFVAENSFVGRDGKPVSGPIEIKMIEVLSAEDIIRSNAQTVSNGQILESEGMIFVDAKANNQSVALGKDKTLSIEMPAKKSDPGVQIFSGNYDSTGNINWTVSGKKENKMVCLPLDMFRRWINPSWDFVKSTKHDSMADVVEGTYRVDSTSLLDIKYENTFVATREFEERLWVVHWLSWEIGWYNSFYRDLPDKGTMTCDLTILNLYLNNLDKDLSYCDSLAWKYSERFHMDHPDIDQYWWDWYGNDRYADSMFHEFYKEGLTSVIQIPSDVNLDAKDARDQLKKKGKTDSEITEILNAYNVRKRAIAKEKDTDGTTKLVANSFQTAELGWINCDRFLSDPDAKDVELLVNIKNDSSFNYVSLTLILDYRKLALNAYTTDNGHYRFGFQPKTTVKLPVGEQATLIAVAYKDGIPYFVTKQIDIVEKGDYELMLKESTKEALDAAVGKIGKPVLYD